MQGFNRTPWNATSRTTAQDALWQHIWNRNTSSQPFMTPCTRQVMNRIPGNVTPPWAGCWGPPRSYSMSGAIYLPAQRKTYEGRLPLTRWWRKSSNMTVGQSSLISLTHHCYDWHPGSRCGWTSNQLTSKVDGGITGSRLRWSTFT